MPRHPGGRPTKKQKYRNSYPEKVRNFIISSAPRMVTHREIAKLFKVNTCTIPAWCKQFPEFLKAEQMRFE